MHHLRGHHADARVAVLGVVPSEQVPQEPSAVLFRPETIGEAGAILEGLELGLGVWVVVGEVGPRHRLGNPQVRQQQGHGLAGHGWAQIRVHRELTLHDPLPPAGLLEDL